MRKNVICLAAITALTGTALAETSTTSELTECVAELRAEVAQLKAEMNGTWLTDQRAEEIRGMVHDVLADADARASLLQDGATAGWDKGFFIASPDGNFRLKIAGQIQFRFLYSSQDDGPDDDHRWGFENTRTRFSFSGHVIDPSWKYFIWAGWTGDGSSLLLDAWVKKDLGNGWSFKAGQFKLPNWREWSVSETRQQFVERSVVDARYASIYAQGVEVSYATDNLHLTGIYSDGLRTHNTPWSTGPSSTSGVIPVQQSNEMALTFRAEWLIDGSWKQYPDFNSFQDDDPMYVLGGALHYQNGEYGTGDDETEIVQWTLDGSAEFGGANLFAAIIGTHVESDSVDRDEFAFIVQGGYFLNENWELIARYEYGDMDMSGVEDLSIITLGVNRFWHKHAVKWTTDVGFGFNPIASEWGGASRGFRTDTTDEDGQIVIRTQMQLLF